MLTIALLTAILFYFAFRTYGRWMDKIFGVSKARQTPAVRHNDGQDFVPTRPAILLGQHFAAIAAVGPIAGPILAGIHYGWLPGILWIALGAVFIGAVHDFSCLMASVRHGARSIGEVVGLYMGKKASVLFSLFIWLSLIYVIVVFADLTASAFVNRPELGEANFGPGVATSSLLYLALSLLMGLALSKWRWSLTRSTLVFLPLIFGAIWVGQQFPISFGGDALVQQRCWDGVILVYCFLASVIPMWLLLQPRGYLGGFILYATFVVGVVGLLFGRHAINFPLWKGWHGADAPPLFPLLFTTIACGACSGFHGLVASGTTSKQLSKETHARTIGYGGMLLEGFVAIVAMSTLMLQSPGSAEMKLGPDEIYARGLAHFMEVMGIPFALGVTFGKLAFATFIYDTLDVATRLGRYLLQELLGLRERKGAFIATILTLIVPMICVFMEFHGPDGNPQPLWKIVWPVFGASNQLLAALSLTGITVWLRVTRRNWWVTAIPAAFMIVITMNSLVYLMVKKMTRGELFDPVTITVCLLLILAVFFITKAALCFRRAPFQPTHESEMESPAV